MPANEIGTPIKYSGLLYNPKTEKSAIATKKKNPNNTLNGGYRQIVCKAVNGKNRIVLAMSINITTTSKWQEDNKVHEVKGLIFDYTPACKRAAAFQK